MDKEIADTVNNTKNEANKIRDYIAKKGADTFFKEYKNLNLSKSTIKSIEKLIKL